MKNLCSFHKINRLYLFAKLMEFSFYIQGATSIMGEKKKKLFIVRLTWMQQVILQLFYSNLINRMINEQKIIVEVKLEFLNQLCFSAQFNFSVLLGLCNSILSTDYCTYMSL